jgi:Flp pilus assembly pilin Flp
MESFNCFLRDDAGQDLVEYSLLIVFVLIASTLIMQNTGSSVIPVWVAGNSTISNAASMVAP